MKKKSPLKKLGEWIDDKVSYHLTQQEEKIKTILISLLKEPDTLKFMPLTGTYYVQNKRLNAVVKVTNSTVHATVNGILLMFSCHMTSAEKLKDVIVAAVVKDVEGVETDLNSMSKDVSDKVIDYINESSRKED